MIPAELDTSFTVALADGRRLGAAIWGDPDGVPVVYNSGLPTCRYEARIFAHEAAKRAGVKLVALERPGYGLSDARPGHRLVDWPRDVAEAMAALGHGRFAVIGVSGGGPFALACAALLPDRVTRAAVVSGLGPLAKGAVPDDVPPSALFRLVRTMAARPRLARATYGFMAFFGRRAGNVCLSLLTLQMPPLDRAVLKRPGIRDDMRDHLLTEPFRSGVARAVEETGLYAQSWGFSLADVQAEIELWHGERDMHVPVAMGRHVAAQLPRCRARILPAAGHLLIAEHAEEILASLVSTTGAQSRAAEGQRSPAFRSIPRSS